MAVENLYTTDCIRTFTGKYVNIFDPKPEMFCIEDIAHSLSQEPRFGGHLKHFYSVGQHCLKCVESIETELKFDMLMHDCSEAYLKYFPRPIKNRMPEYKKIENDLMIFLSKIFGFAYPLNERVKKVDEIILGIEWDRCMLKGYNYPEKMQWVEGKFLNTYLFLKPTFVIKSLTN